MWKGLLIKLNQVIQSKDGQEFIKNKLGIAVTESVQEAYPHKTLGIIFILAGLGFVVYRLFF